jgi:hypothetical protein
MVTGGTGVVIITWGFIGAMQTIAVRAAVIVGAGVAVTAIGRGTACASACEAGIIDGAGIAVIARDAIGAWRKPATASIGVASDHEARGIGSCRLGAGDYGLGIDHTKVGQLLGIADEGAIAEVPVLQGRAITIQQTFTVHSIPGAGRGLALVGNGAGVAIVALNRVGNKEAASGFITGIVGAGVIVIAIHG